MSVKNKKLRFIQFISGLLLFVTVNAQSDTLQKKYPVKDTAQKDLIDIFKKIAKKDFVANKINSKPGKLLFSIFPAAGYGFQTSFAGVLVANFAFYTDSSSHAKLSVVDVYPIYTLDNQFILPVKSNIWSKENKYNFRGDWRFYQYPQYTYGLGGHSSLNNADLLEYSYISIREAVLKLIASNLYVGIGYDMDYHYNINEKGNPDGSISDFEKYGKTQTSTSSGLSFNFLYDNRKNSINPSNGFFANIIYRPNFIFLGSDQNWQSIVLDFRKYFQLPGSSHNVLAFWSYTWLTTGGKVPYSDLPSTGWDTYSNIGRGYKQNRFRGPGMLYLESEYRFALSQNGLFGGVVFANAQSISEWPSNKFDVILPGTGVGLRVKFNKHSQTNLAIDYAFGLENYGGVFINLGEVF